jgi:uncharacterized protein YuzE
MKVTYDPLRDKVRILFNDAPITKTVAAAPQMVMDYDTYGMVVGIEMSNASLYLHNPRAVDFTEESSGAAAPEDL